MDQTTSDAHSRYRYFEKELWGPLFCVHNDERRDIIAIVLFSATREKKEWEKRWEWKESFAGWAYVEVIMTVQPALVRLTSAIVDHHDDVSNRQSL